MTEETTHPKDGDHVKYKTVRLPVETCVLRIDFQVKDEEAANEAWRLMVKASDCSVITDPVLRREYDILNDKTFTLIEGRVVAHPDVPGPQVLRNPYYLDVQILGDFDD